MNEDQIQRDIQKGESKTVVRTSFRNDDIANMQRDVFFGEST